MTFDLEILLPGKLKPDTALSLHSESLRDECVDCVLSPSDLPKPEYITADETEKHQVGRYWWWEVKRIIPFKDEPRFPILTKLMSGLLTIPASNADSTLVTESFLYNY